MTHFELIQSANAIAGLGLVIFLSHRLKAYLKACLKGPCHLI